MPLCLTMIVRNEAKVLQRCLGAARPFVDRAVIVDTGSTDDTMAIATRTLKQLELPGLVIPSDWKGFGPSRTEAFKHAREFVQCVPEIPSRRRATSTPQRTRRLPKPTTRPVSSDKLEDWYAVVVDADELMSGSLPSAMSADAYGVWMQINNVRYKSVRVFRLDHVWRYVGVLHEFPTTDAQWQDEMMETLTIDPTRQDGARSNDPDKYANDATVLEKAFNDESDQALRARYAFYCAQSYRDARQDEPAARWYLRRAEMGGGYNWEEIYVALLEAGRAFERLSQFALAERTYLRAHHQWPARAEASRELARIFSAKAAEAKPVGALFVEI